MVRDRGRGHRTRLLGLRERVEVFHGTIDAAPRPGGGFRFAWGCRSGVRRDQGRGGGRRGVVPKRAANGGGIAPGCRRRRRGVRRRPGGERRAPAPARRGVPADIQMPQVNGSTLRRPEESCRRPGHSGPDADDVRDGPLRGGVIARGRERLSPQDGAARRAVAGIATVARGESLPSGDPALLRWRSGRRWQPEDMTPARRAHRPGVGGAAPGRPRPVEHRALCAPAPRRGDGEDPRKPDPGQDRFA